METEYRQKQQIGTRLATAKAMPMLEFPHNKKEFPYSFSDNPHMAAAICNFFQTRLLCHQDAEILSFHQDNPATNRIGPPSGSNVTIVSCFGRCYGGLQTESLTNRSFKV